MHLGSLDWPGRRPFAPQSPQIMVEQRRRNRDARPPRGHLRAEAAPAGVPGLDGLRLHADLSLPCLAARHATASDRHRSVQIRGVQTERAIRDYRVFDAVEIGPPWF